MSLKHAKLIVFARAPVKGQVKTRLANRVGDDRALEIYRDMLDAALQEMSGCGLPVCVYSDHPEDSYFDHWKQKGMACQQQTGEDLGERMFNALQAEKSDMTPVILMGSDCPQLSCEMIRKVVDELHHGKQVVIVPSTDGGYVLIAFAEKIYPQVFEGIRWSTAKVMQQTEEKLRSLGLSYDLLTPLLDIDDFDDYQNWLGISQRL